MNIAIMYGVILKVPELCHIALGCFCPQISSLLSLCNGSTVSSTVGSAAAARCGTACRTVSVLEFQGYHGNSALKAAVLFLEAARNHKGLISQVTV